MIIWLSWLWYAYLSSTSRINIRIHLISSLCIFCRSHPNSEPLFRSNNVFHLNSKQFPIKLIGAYLQTKGRLTLPLLLFSENPATYCISKQFNLTHLTLTEIWFQFIFLSRFRFHAFTNSQRFSGFSGDNDRFSSLKVIDSSRSLSYILALFPGAQQAIIHRWRRVVSKGNNSKWQRINRCEFESDSSTFSRPSLLHISCSILSINSVILSFCSHIIS